MKLLGVASFVIGVAALCVLVVRRGRGLPTRGLDYTMMFLGLAGAIGGLAAVFVKI